MPNRPPSARETAYKPTRLSGWIKCLRFNGGAQLNRHSIDQVLNLEIRFLGHTLRVLQKKCHPVLSLLEG